jgi:tetratricopeptide (TPR) repeat protein
VSVLLVPYAAFALLWLYEAFRRRNIGPAVVYSLIAVTIVAGSLANPLGVGGAAEARGFYSLGVDYSHSDYEKALEAFDESIGRDPSFAPAWKMRGWANYKLGRHVAATEDLLQAVRLDSSFVDALYTLGVVYQVREQHERAGPAYERVIVLDPEHKEALTNLADVHMRRGEYELALPLLEGALEVDRAFPNAIFGLGSYYEHVGRSDEAADQYRAIAHLPAGRLGLTRLLVKDGKLDEADSLLNQWASAYPRAPDIATLRRLVRDYRNRSAP